MATNTDTVTSQAKPNEPIVAIRDADFVPGQRVTFHIEEFKALKTEIGELVKASLANVQYALLMSGGIFTWLITHKDSAEKSGLELAWYLPAVISVFFGVLSAVGYVRIGTMAVYLLELERNMACGRRGWESYFQPQTSWFGGIYGLAWLALIVVDAFIGWRLAT
ncbi:hypothetical protein [Azospirillum canadense]|uniref:hypothetical protein n=1 Tax=Azospirillum canadense TaxID=403962 RepID=UPI002225E0F3|nr:hypothetical protein [Azospirillum canadense]MCW2240549.1 hypothetical protein [Azospirillum canadense]